jgi:hypothetical protein
MFPVNASDRAVLERGVSKGEAGSPQLIEEYRDGVGDDRSLDVIMVESAMIMNLAPAGSVEWRMRRMSVQVASE